MPRGDGSRTPPVRDGDTAEGEAGDDPGEWVAPAARPPSHPGLRTVVLGVGLVFVVVFGAMTISVIGELRIERWTISTLLLLALFAGALLVIGMIALALISAIRNPPED